MAILAPLIAILLAARLYALSRFNLWFDESFSWQMTQFSIDEMVRRLAGDVHPPLFYFALKSWEAFFGDSIFSLRAHSFFWHCIAMFGSYRLANRLADEKSRPLAGLLAVCLLSANELFFRYSMEARMYSLGYCLLFWSLDELLRCLETPPQLQASWWRFALLNGALALTHNFALFAAATELAFLFVFCFQHRTYRMTWAFRAGGVFLLCVGPWLPVLYSQTMQVRADYWAPSVSSLSPFGWEFWKAATYKLLAAGAMAISMLGDDAPAYSGIAVVVFFLSPLVFLFQKREGFRLLVATIVAPLLLAVGACFVTGRNIIHYRYLIFQSGLLWVGYAALLAQIRNGVLRVGAITALVMFQLHFTELYFKTITRPGATSLNPMVSYLRASMASGERLVCLSYVSFFPLKHSTQSQPPIYQLRGAAPFRHYDGAPIFTNEDLIGTSQIFSAKNRAVWLVGTHLEHAHFRAIPTGWILESERDYEEALPFRGPLLVRKWVYHPT